MKDILKMMRFDLISCLSVEKLGGSSMIGPGIVSIVFFLAMDLFISPVFSFTFIAGAGALIVPLQSAKNDDLDRLYGVLPIKRRNITRARFLYIYLLHIVCFVIALLLAFTSVSLDLNRFLPQNMRESELLKKISDSFNVEELSKMIPIFIGFAAFSCLMFAFMEMMGQILGREHEMKILIIVLAVIVVGIMGGVWVLEQLGSPEIKLPDIPLWALLPTTGLIVFGICLLFGEITAAKLSKREL